VRWQLDGWLTGRSAGSGPTAGIVRLRLLPDGVVPDAGLQLGLWGEAGEERDRAHRALTRVQALLGPESVVIAVLGGGRGVRDRVRLVPWGDEPTPGLPDEPPWPGRLPGPLPATVPVDPVPAVVSSSEGALITVSARLALSATPARVAVGDAAPVEVVGWAGPWPADERWWSGEASRRARFQLLLADGRALLMMLSGGHWSVEGIYD
jgi:protein ImuB